MEVDNIVTQLKDIHGDEFSRATTFITLRVHLQKEILMNHSLTGAAITLMLFCDL